MKVRPLADAKVALVYDRVNTPFGGAEHVLMALHQLFPKAPLCTAVYEPSRAPWAQAFQVRPSFLQSWPGARQAHRQYVAAMPLAFESLDLSSYDVVISVTSAEAKGVITQPHQLHLCYLLTPTRYLWSHYQEYTTGSLGPLKRVVFAYLRWWDQAAALRPDYFIPISRRVASRCQEYYHRATTEVIYPPLPAAISVRPPLPLPTAVATAGWQSSQYYLVVARLVSYKRVKEAVLACQELERPLVVIGDGPERGDIQKLLTTPGRSSRQSTPASGVCYLPTVPAAELPAYYQHCRAFLAPGEEDFGISVLEAHAHGKPAIIHQLSGVAEVSPAGRCSIQLPAGTVSQIVQAIKQLEATSWDASYIQQQVIPYNTEMFGRRFAATVSQLWRRFQAGDRAPQAAG